MPEEETKQQTPDQKLIAYVQQEIENGTSLHEVARVLFDHKWTREEIESAVSVVTGEQFATHAHVRAPIAPLPSITQTYVRAWALIVTRARHIALSVAVYGVGTVLIFMCAYILEYVVGPTSVATWLPWGTKIAHSLLLFVSVSYVTVAFLAPVATSWRTVVQRCMPVLIGFLWSAVLVRFVIVGGVLMCVVPAFMLWFMYSLWPIVAVDEKVFGTRAFARSSALIAEFRKVYAQRFFAGPVLYGVLFGIAFVLRLRTESSLLVFIYSSLQYLLLVWAYAYQSVVYVAIKQRYTGRIVPRNSTRLMAICVAVLPLLVLSIALVLSTTTVDRVFQAFF